MPASTEQIKEILEQYSWKESAEILKKLILSRDI